MPIRALPFETSPTFIPAMILGLTLGGGLSRALAVELAPLGIRVNYLCPGFIPTAMTSRYTEHPQVSKGLLAQMPMCRFGAPEEAAKAALFFASDDSAYTTGEGLMVDGGMSLNLAQIKRKIDC
ncbi:MAG: SDR family oxidoreductase [Rhodomicrobium sp.]|nr:SDR family oxidoreductase [Rhodomicrobium sp.]